MTDPKPAPQYASDFPEGACCYDFLDPESGLRMLVVRGFLSFCAYVGVQAEHTLAGLEDLQFACHWGITYRGWGEEGTPHPAGWFWWGWDYAHGFDVLEAPEEVAEIQRLIDARFSPERLHRKRWSLAEVQEDALDVLMNLRAALEHSAQLSRLVTHRPLPR